MTKEDFIRKTFDLAKKGLGTTWPNPLVGSVIVKDGKIIGEGFHKARGLDHAEIDAIKNSTEPVEGATLYVNLEPCCHTNKTTPPCAQRLIKERIKKVVIANLDPNEEVNGKGVELLRAHGVEVEYGVLQEEGEKLNEVFFLAQRKKRPFIHFKAAVTLDGMTAMTSGESQWITGEKARAHVHELRSQHQAIIVGGQTVRKDNPKLTVRLPGYSGKQPYRIVLSQSEDLPQTHHLFSDEYKDQTLVFNDIDLMLQELFKKNIISVMLEAGPVLASEFLKRGLIDRVSLYQNPGFLGSGRGLFSEPTTQKLNHRPRLQDIES
ncbi:MAG: bifunctional diaminohydroxyphosphoribosylaminopyrimidine deaminase/5-amino-6-(5-phosphoribosylamino)uracil reductase RibD, partial [Bacteriovoracia bacterium]